MRNNLLHKTCNMKLWSCDANAIHFVMFSFRPRILLVCSYYSYYGWKGYCYGCYQFQIKHDQRAYKKCILFPFPVSVTTAHLMERYTYINVCKAHISYYARCNWNKYISIYVHERWLPVIPFCCRAFRICTYFVGLSSNSLMMCCCLFYIRMEDKRGREWSPGENI